MVKKVYEDAILMKKILIKVTNQHILLKKFKISKQKISYLKKTEIKYARKRRNKLPEKYIKVIIRLVKNKTTSNMGGCKITSIII